MWTYKSTVYTEEICIFAIINITSCELRAYSYNILTQLCGHAHSWKKLHMQDMYDVDVGRITRISPLHACMNYIMYWKNMFFHQPRNMLDPLVTSLNRLNVGTVPLQCLLHNMFITPSFRSLSCKMPLSIIHTMYVYDTVYIMLLCDNHMTRVWWAVLNLEQLFWQETGPLWIEGAYCHQVVQIWQLHWLSLMHQHFSKKKGEQRDRGIEERIDRGREGWKEGEGEGGKSD